MGSKRLDRAQTNFLEINGKRLEYRCIAPAVAGRPTLVFLHEGLGCVALWRDFPDQLAVASGCGALVYSRAGYGESDSAELPRQPTYMHNEALRILPQVLAKLDIADHILIGHSDGGSIALVYAGGVRPTTLRGVITEAAHVFNEEICVREIGRIRELYLTSDLEEKMSRYHRDADKTFWGWNDIWLHPDFWHWNIESYLPTIAVPLLVMQGVDDQYGSVRQVEAIVAGVGNSAEKHLIPDCRHTPHHEQREATLAAMVAFISRLT